MGTYARTATIKTATMRIPMTSALRNSVRIFGTIAVCVVMGPLLGACSSTPRTGSYKSPGEVALAAQDGETADNAPASSAPSATGGDDTIYVGDIEIRDPLEGYNRAVFALNQGLDNFIFEPATYVYRTVVPKVARDGVHNFLENLKSPVYLVNEVLQGDWEDAGLVTKRFFVNSLAGVGGLMDVASWEGDTYLPEDFGQTLAVWGAGNGVYIVWPIFGPSSTRDAFGRLVDLGFDPLFWYGISEDHEAVGYIRTGATIIDTKDQLMDGMNDLEKNSLDFYAAVRSIVYQRRGALIKDLNPGEGEGFSIPDYDDEQ